MDKKKSLEIEIFDNIDKEFEEEFYNYSETLEYAKGTSPFLSNDLLKYFYIVLDGKIKTYQINFENSKEQTLFIYQRGDMFDIVSLLDKEPHEVIYEVLQDCIVLRLPIEKVRFWVNGSTSFKNFFFPYVASKIRYTENLSTELSLYSVKERLMHLLVESINPNSHFKYKLLNNLSNSEISKLLGTVRHVIERAIKELKQEKVIKTSRKNITVINVEKLLEKTTKMLHK